ncbi:hypothetical protein [Streptomyces sp. NRRL S-237]|uniref:hypothetical protein n=1 Tax=Streptomyces sp. NRRL S-237 TaxID=1463895 RepID=UPI00068E277C|nr:hypothetical protein [Streptomyces sp. NRRL S-237]
MAGTRSADGRVTAAATADLLRRLLAERTAYRTRWEQQEVRRTPGPVSSSAVARVLALHLWDSGERPDTERDLARRLKDRVHRALGGEFLSRETLEWFVAAFAMDGADAMALRALWSGTAQVVPAADAGGPVTHTLRLPQYLPVRQRHRTVSVFERHVIGRDGAPERHRTTRAVMACEDGVGSFPCRLPPGAVDVTVLRGARVGARREFPGSTPVVELAFPASLAAGQIASLEYEVVYGPFRERVTEYRRVAHARADNVDLVVEFPPVPRPARVWWATWDHHRDGTVLGQTPVALGRDGSVHRFVPALEHAAAGFRWAW